MSFYEQYQALLNRAEKAVESALEIEVAQAVKDVMADQADLQVYSYEASAMAMATRRVDFGGLGDQKFMIHDVVKITQTPFPKGGNTEYELTVEDTAPFQGEPVNYTTLSDVVGHGTKGFNQPGPRPFVAGTEMESASSGRAYSALMRGMKRQGF